MFETVESVFSDFKFEKSDTRFRTIFGYDTFIEEA